jgi:hypothetical protein
MKTVFTIFFGFMISLGTSQTLLKPDRIFDGYQIKEDWAVLVEGNKILDVGPTSNIKVPKGSKEIIFKKHDLDARTNRRSFSCIIASI